MKILTFVLLIFATLASSTTTCPKGSAFDPSTNSCISMKGKCRDQFHKDPKPYADRIIKAVQSIDKPSLKSLMPCAGQIGPWESEFSQVSPEQFANYIFEKRHSSEGRKGPLPFQVVKTEKNDSLYLVAMDKFIFEKDIPNDIGVFIFVKTRSGWSLNSMIETNKSNLEDVFLAQLDPKAYDKKYKK